MAAALLHTVRGAQVNQLHLFLQQLPQSSGLLPERDAVLPVAVDTQDPERRHGAVSPVNDSEKPEELTSYLLMFTSCNRRL